ncbi:MAG: hypothetical protein J0L92_29745, partial [Deltaproteobacteria bacterium]|nr:hypothetical protein [Deltaproteobacteria bacterium]
MRSRVGREGALRHERVRRLLCDPAFLLRFGPLLETLAPATFLSSVVVAELLQGARGEPGRARVRRAL